MSAYKSISDLFEAHKTVAPEKIIEAIRAFFVSAGNKYRRGLMTEEEFYTATYYFTVHLSLWEMINGIRVDRDQLSNDPSFKASWTEWKESGRIEIRPWMNRCIRQYGNMERSVEWIFTVIDARKIPLCEFDTIPDDAVEEFPDLWFRIGEYTTDMVLRRRCTDINILLCDPAPEKKAFVLHFDGGLIARVTVDKLMVENNREWHYICTGTITDYIEKPQRIDIEFSKGGSMDVSFGKRPSAHWKLGMNCDLIPHPRWAAYNIVRLTRALRLEAEYKILRLPYMLEDENTDAVRKKSKERRSIRDEKIIPLFGYKDY